MDFSTVTTRWKGITVVDLGLQFSTIRWLIPKWFPSLLFILMVRVGLVVTMILRSKVVVRLVSLSPLVISC